MSERQNGCLRQSTTSALVTVMLSAISSSWLISALSAMATRSMRSIARQRIKPKPWMKTPYSLAPSVGRVSSRGKL